MTPDNEMPLEIFFNNKDKGIVDGGNLDMRYWTKYLRAAPDKVMIDRAELERVIMLIETAWMDIEPIPCEVEAVNILKQILEAAMKVEK